MTDPLIQLAERVEQAEGPSRELDKAIMAAFTDEIGTRPLWMLRAKIATGAVGTHEAPHFTASLDAAMQLAGADPYAVLFEAMTRCPYSETDGAAFLKALPRYATAASLRARAREG